MLAPFNPFCAFLWPDSRFSRESHFSTASLQSRISHSNRTVNSCTIYSKYRNHFICIISNMYILCRFGRCNQKYSEWPQRGRYSGQTNGRWVGRNYYWGCPDGRGRVPVKHGMANVFKRSVAIFRVYTKHIRSSALEFSIAQSSIYSLVCMVGFVRQRYLRCRSDFPATRDWFAAEDNPH